MSKHFFTSESVTEGHPDKVCDRISDSVVDAILKQDKSAHIACETAVTTNHVTVIGEISTSCDVDIESIAREAIRYIGYDDDKYGFNCDTVRMNILLVALLNAPNFYPRGEIPEPIRQLFLLHMKYLPSRADQSPEFHCPVSTPFRHPLPFPASMPEAENFISCGSKHSCHRAALPFFGRVAPKILHLL